MTRFVTGVRAGSGMTVDVNNSEDGIGLTIFYGVAVPGTINEAFIEALAGRIVLLSRDSPPLTVMTAGPTQKIYWALPATFGGSSTSFIDEDTQLPVGMGLAASNISVTDSFGTTRLYNVWESDVAGLGFVRINVR